MTVTGINCGWNKLKRKGTSINTVEPVFYGTPAFLDQSAILQCRITGLCTTLRDPNLCRRLEDTVQNRDRIM